MRNRRRPSRLSLPDRSLFVRLLSHPFSNQITRYIVRLTFGRTNWPDRKQKRKRYSKCGSCGLPCWFPYCSMFISERRCGGLNGSLFAMPGKIFVIAAVLNLLCFFWFRTKRYRAAVDLAKAHPEDFRAVKRWMNYWVVLLSVADSEAVLAFCFRMGNKTLQESLPLYGVGFLLTLSLWPRPIWASTRIGDK